MTNWASMKIKAKVYPNPFSSNLSVEVLTDLDRQVVFRLYNGAGNLIKMSYWKLVKGNNKILLDSLQNLAQGLYTVEIKNEDNEVLHKFELVKN
jgi:hypothetical protein